MKPLVERAAIDQTRERVSVSKVAHLPLELEQIDPLLVLLNDHAEYEDGCDHLAGACGEVPCGCPSAKTGGKSGSNRSRD
jgi:hypothetical protein